ncbi:MAG: prolyl oligopeptidase family serine peptidase [Prevotellaceae bacterium]|nr:prolyl oligopeptidase family serine peptidase [Prevotellaceae bacterium]
MKKTILPYILLSLTTTVCMAQGTVQDYKNAFAIRGKYSNKVANGSVNIMPVRNDSTGVFRYSTFNGDSTVWYEVDIKTGSKTQTSAPPRRHNERRGGGDGHHWMEVRDEKDGRAENPVNKNTFIVHKNNNLYLVNGNDDEHATAITADGVDTCYYSSWGSWSKDGKYYATVLIKPAPKHYVTYTLSSPTDQVQPKYSQQEYAKPGDSLNYRIPVVVDVENRKTIYPKSTDLFKSQYQVTVPRWDENGKTLTFEFNERGHKTYRVLEMNLEGDVKTLIEEKNDKYVAYSRNWRRDLNDDYILWKSDRDGHAHIYLYDRKKDRLTQVTKGDYWVRGVQHSEIDEKGKGYIIFSANGMNYKNMGRVASSLDGEIAEEDPYNVHYYRIDLNGKNLVALTPERGNHSITLSADKTALVDTYSSVDKAPVTVLRSAVNGKIINTLETADISRLEANGWKAPEVFVAPGRDGKTDMWGIIQRPSNFDPNKKYPVIEYIYSGPGDQYVPKSFTPWLWNLADLAELGFIVVQLDAMTTSFRSLDFEQVCYKNLKDSGFPDRIEWIKAAAEKYPYMDISNMGIYGCSAGGQEALGALLFHPDFYKVAYAACGCHDNRMDKIWWNEQWMGYPVDNSYIECSNVENAKNLQGKLMLLVGEMDDNVDPSSSYQVVNALIKANKDFEFILIPGARHTMGETFGEHKRYDFFVKNLHGVEPPAWEDVK